MTLIRKIKNINLKNYRVLINNLSCLTETANKLDLAAQYLTNNKAKFLIQIKNQQKPQNKEQQQWTIRKQIHQINQKLTDKNKPVIQMVQNQNHQNLKICISLKALKLNKEKKIILQIYFKTKYKKQITLLKMNEFEKLINYFKYFFFLLQVCVNFFNLELQFFLQVKLKN
ncbi:transmembrane protein, putative (macronuclear) [Tetrahymena thermophila SB210]|uniref:Transmembrane protein, putative n=1 Tax=Tetrahymena thermophila (strain SB210) TaxID=312017 RepID=W7XK88_TETTS|nr:transmembrane protein, putative [Tetrahymena thermophila SB210]EWS76291.1 transmembrane protein, putative [Tetrahymena thermophila SB210]|eukprot:XP_012651075.1 transmembrane protein, putative [Tetrahymena thermophila SB210]